MIYKEPTIYKQGYYPEIEVHEHVLEYADDWIDISNEFSIESGFNVYKAFNTIGDVSDLKILYSEKIKAIYFNNDYGAIASNTKIPFDNSWKIVLTYNGNRFNTIMQNYMLYPIDVNRGVIIDNLTTAYGATTPSLGFWGFVDNPRVKLGVKKITESNIVGAEGYGISTSKILAYVKTI